MLTKDMSVASALVGADINQNARADRPRRRLQWTESDDEEMLVESDEQISRPRPLLGPGVWRKINDVNIEGWRNALGYRPDSGNDQRMSKTSAFFLGPGHIKCLPQDDVSQVAVHNWFLKNLADADFK